MKMAENTTVINVRVPQEMAEKIDEEIERLGYSSRSEFVRDAIRRMENPTLKEEVLEELLKRSIEAKSHYLKHEEVVEKTRE